MTSLRTIALALSLLNMLFVGSAIAADTPATAETAPGRQFKDDDVPKLLTDAREHGDARRGAAIFASARFACVACHKVGTAGGRIGPELTAIGGCQKPEYIIESVLWPKKQIKEGYAAIAVITAEGKQQQGHFVRESEESLVLKDPATETTFTIAKSDIESRRDVGSLMPDGLANAMTSEDLRDVLRFLLDLGRKDADDVTALVAEVHKAASFPFENKPLRPELWPNASRPVNRDRTYDFYAKEAAYFRTQRPLPMLLPQYGDLDGGKYGHWGNQNEGTWSDDRWAKLDLGTLLCGVFRAGTVTVPKGVCVRLGDNGELSCCFNPETLSYDAVWKGGFIKLSAVRHGFMDGLKPDGELLPPPEIKPDAKKPAQPFVYHGFYRHGRRVIFSYRIGDEEWLDAPWVEDGQFSRQVGPAKDHPLSDLVLGGPRNWPQEVVTAGKLGGTKPYALDTITPPYENPWHVPLFFGDHDFLPDGTAYLCTMQGDVFRVDGIDAKLEKTRWRRVASGLHQSLGLVVVDGAVYVLGRDQITRLHDLNGDGEFDFYECVTNSYVTSPGGHDFITGLEHDAQGNFYAASGNQGLIRIPPDRKPAQVVATGLRNPDGLALLPDGICTASSEEGDWVPASMVCAARINGGKDAPHFGYRGPKSKQTPDLPLVYFPRGVDNCGGGQAVVTSDRWGPLKGQLLHFSYGAGTHFLILRDEVDGQMQGAAIQLPGDFDAGVHRGRFSPVDGQLYVSGMGGWGSYTWADGSFQRLRYTGDPVQLPIGYHVHANGVLLKFLQPLDAKIAADAKNHFAQIWNYRYSSAYGSPEFSTRHPGVAGHDPLAITSAHILPDGKSLFLEMPDLQPVNQLHLYLKIDPNDPQEIFATVHKLDVPFTNFPGYKPVEKRIAAHPILVDLAMLANRVPNPYRNPIAKARSITIDAGSNLTFATKSLTVKSGEPIQFTFQNPDVVPHNWVLLKPGTLQPIGEQVNRLIADPAAAVRNYVPLSPDVLAYTDLVDPQGKFVIYFTAPAAPGRYPFLCTFPGHWMVMNGELVVEPQQ